MQRTPALIGRHRRMRGDTLEMKVHLGHRLAVFELGSRVGGRVPANQDVDALEHARVEHEVFPAAGLFGWRSVDADGARGTGALKELRNRYSSGHCARADEIVPTRVTWPSRNDRLASGNGFLRHTGERVLFRPEGDDRFPAAGARDERGRQARSIWRDGESVVGQILNQRPTRFELPE